MAQANLRWYVSRLIAVPTALLLVGAMEWLREGRVWAAVIVAALFAYPYVTWCFGYLRLRREQREGEPS